MFMFYISFWSGVRKYHHMSLQGLLLETISSCTGIEPFSAVLHCDMIVIDFIHIIPVDVYRYRLFLKKSGWWKWSVYPFFMDIGGW